MNPNTKFGLRPDLHPLIHLKKHVESFTQTLTHPNFIIDILKGSKTGFKFKNSNFW